MSPALSHSSYLSLPKPPQFFSLSHRPLPFVYLFSPPLPSFFCVSISPQRLMNVSCNPIMIKKKKKEV